MTSRDVTVGANRVRRLLSKARNIGSRMSALDFEGGWQIAPYDPAKLLACFPHIWLRSGLKLSAYQYFDGGNGNGFPVVLPADKTLPAPPPDLCIVWSPTGQAILGAGSTSIPNWLSLNIGSFLEGDGSALSYLEASLASRELQELGARWHGAYWSDHEVLTEPPEYDISEFTWHDEPPTDWRPQVKTMAGGGTLVIFHTFTDLLRERITRHTDSFENGYAFTTDETVLAIGGFGKIY